MWGQQDLSLKTKSKTFKLDDLSIIIKVEGNEGEKHLAITSILSDKEDFDFDKQYKNAEWTYSYLDSDDKLFFMPSYPRIPMLVKIRTPFSIPANSDFCGYISTSAEVSVILNKNELARFSRKTPFKSLYGSTSSGIVCRYYESDFISKNNNNTELDYKNIKKSKILHPIKIKNQSGNVLKISELCIFGDQLSIFENTNIMFSETIVFTCTPSNIRMSTTSVESKLKANSRLLVKPTLSEEEQLLGRSVELLKSMM